MCRGGGTWPISQSTTKEIFLTLPTGGLWNQAWIWCCDKQNGQVEKREKKVTAGWTHSTEAYSHVEWELNLGMGQQLRGYGCHFGGHQHPCRGGRGTWGRCILKKCRKIYNENAYNPHADLQYTCWVLFTEYKLNPRLNTTRGSICKSNASLVKCCK